MDEEADDDEFVINSTRHDTDDDSYDNDPDVADWLQIAARRLEASSISTDDPSAAAALQRLTQHRTEAISGALLSSDVLRPESLHRVRSTIDALTLSTVQQTTAAPLTSEPTRQSSSANAYKPRWPASLPPSERPDIPLSESVSLMNSLFIPAAATAPVIDTAATTPATSPDQSHLQQIKAKIVNKRKSNTSSASNNTASFGVEQVLTSRTTAVCQEHATSLARDAERRNELNEEAKQLTEHKTNTRHKQQTLLPQAPAATQRSSHQLVVNKRAKEQQLQALTRSIAHVINKRRHRYYQEAFLMWKRCAVTPRTLRVTAAIHNKFHTQQRLFEQWHRNVRRKKEERREREAEKDQLRHQQLQRRADIYCQARILRAALTQWRIESASGREQRLIDRQRKDREKRVELLLNPKTNNAVPPAQTSAQSSTTPASKSPTTAPSSRRATPTKSSTPIRRSVARATTSTIASSPYAHLDTVTPQTPVPVAPAVTVVTDKDVAVQRKRDEARCQRAEQLSAVLAAKQKAKAEQIAERAAAQKQREAEAKMSEFERFQAEKARQLSIEQEKQQSRVVANAHRQVAVQYCHHASLMYRGWIPWRQVMEARLLQWRQVEIIANENALKRFFHQWRHAVRTMKRERAEAYELRLSKAAVYYQRRQLTVMMRHWLHGTQTRQERYYAGWTHYCRRISKHTVIAWRNEARRLAAARSDRLALVERDYALPMSRRNVRRYYFGVWQRAMAVRRQAKAHAAHVASTMTRVNEWLTAFRSNSSYQVAGVNGG